MIRLLPQVERTETTEWPVLLASISRITSTLLYL